MKELSENLKRLRESKKVSKSDLARLLGIAPSAYSVYETGLKKVGDREPTLTNLIKLAAFFNVTVDELLNGNEYERCKTLWESVGFEVKNQSGKIFLKQLELPEYLSQKNSQEINILAYASPPVVFDNEGDFIKMTYNMEKFCQKRFLWNCRDFFVDKIFAEISMALNEKIEPEENEESETDIPFDYNLIKGNDSIKEGESLFSRTIKITADKTKKMSG